MGDVSREAKTLALSVKAGHGALAVFLLNVAALLLVTMSVTMLGDFTRRLFGADPDSLGILAIASQAAFTVAATSTFTKTGWALLRRTLGRDVQANALWRLALAIALLVVTTVTWRWLPQWLAGVYNSRAYYLNQSLEAAERDGRANVQHSVRNPGYLRAEVLRNYQRAVALDPTLWLAYSNTGKVLESFYRYEAAEEQYRSAIRAEPADTADLIPYSNLARAMVRDGKPLDALRVIADAERLPKGDGTVEAALARNKAWAEYELGFYTAAARDAARSNSAAGNCILAEAYGKLGRIEEERAAWIRYRKQHAVLTWDDPVVKPDCELLAEAFDERH